MPITFLVAASVFFLQHRHLTDVQASLSRYESVRIPTSLAADQFRVITQTILDTSHVKIVTYRLESVDKHFATLDDGHGDSNGSTSSLDQDTDLHVTEAIVLIDHVDSKKCVKILPKVGGGQGYSVMSVQDDYVLDDEVTITNSTGVYSQNETVELFQSDGRSYSLSLN